MRVLLGASIILGLSSPALTQSVSVPQTNPSEEKEIVVTGLADGARVVEVDFDKVWKNCAECKRALRKLDKLAQNYRDELTVAGLFAGSGGHCGNAPPSPLMTFQRSSADVVGEPPRTVSSLAGGLCAARAEDRSKRTFEAVARKNVAPEQARLHAYMRSFIDQVALQVADATEAERVARGATAGLTDKKRTKLAAKNLKRIDVTQAVIRRMDATDFKIVLPDPPPRGPARGGIEPIR